MGAISAEIVEQWRDQKWRLNNLYKIKDKTGEAVKFVMNSAQEKLFDDMWFLNIILKARQRGFTTFIALFFLDCCLFEPNISAGMIAHNLDDAKVIFRDKVKFAYENVHKSIREAVPATIDSANTLSFANGSSIRVGTSMRSGTLQYLHISEHGKICSKYPEKALEIKTGALNAVEAGQFIFIESTAEGRSGDFFDFCKTAEDLKIAGKRLTKLDFKFHFFPWQEDSGYRLSDEDTEIVELTREEIIYFEELEAKHGVKLDANQKAWYVKKARTQGEEMKREYPATPKEAFEAAVQGAYFSSQFALIRKQQRICRVLPDPSLPLNTFWDLGLNDKMSIWLHQRYLKEDRFVGYYENTGEGFAFYKMWLDNWATERSLTWGSHFAPHDIEVRVLDTVAETRKVKAAKIGLNFRTVARPVVKLDSIHAARTSLAHSWFEEGECEVGINHLESYRKKWDKVVGVFLKEPLHDDASHGADAYQTFALADERDMIGGGSRQPTRRPQLGTQA